MVDDWRLFYRILALISALVILGGLFLFYLWYGISSYYCISAGTECNLFNGGNPIGRIAVFNIVAGLLGVSVGLYGIVRSFRGRKILQRKPEINL